MTRTIPNLANAPAAASPAALDVQQVRSQFPLLDRKVHTSVPLVYLDNAATTQKPRAVIDAVSRFYEHDNANIHRAVHELSQSATRLYDQARTTVQRFIHAADPAEIIYTRGTTEGINLVAHSYARQVLSPGDEVIVSHLEHHSNIVPWQMVCQASGAKLSVIPITPEGELRLDVYAQLLSSRTKLVAVNHVSNALGTINPVSEIIRLAHAAGARVLVDGAQWVAHGATDVQAIDADFYVFSGHKLYGPTGVGVLYGKRALLEAMQPYQGGGDMIASVSFTGTTYAELPAKFEAGTPDISGAVGLAAAINFVQGIGLDAIAAHEHALLERATAGLQAIPGVRLVGTAKHKAAVVSFVVEDPPLSTLDIGMQLDMRGIAVRTGHHCCQPLMEHMGLTATARASFAMYNTLAEADAFVAAVRDIVTQARSKRASSLQAAQASAGAGVGSRADEVAYAPAVAASPAEAAAEIESLFEFFEDWAGRYQQIIEMGEKLPPMPASLKTPENFVKGCQSTVHIAARRKPGAAGVIEFLADSDADIVRGLIALLQRVYSGQKAAAVLKFDAPGFIHRLGLDQHLSMTRRNGLDAMVRRIQGLAKLVASEQGS